MKNVYPATCSRKDKYKETNKIKANMHEILHTIAPTVAWDEGSLWLGKMCGWVSHKETKILSKCAALGPTFWGLQEWLHLCIGTVHLKSPREKQLRELALLTLLDQQCPGTFFPRHACFHAFAHALHSTVFLWILGWLSPMVTSQTVPDYSISIHAYTPICSPTTPFVCITWREYVSFNIAGLACPLETNLNRCWQCLVCLLLYNPPQSRALCHSQYQEPNKYVEMNNWSCHCVTWYYFLQDRAFNSYISAWMWHTVTYLTDVSYLLLEAM